VTNFESPSVTLGVVSAVFTFRFNLDVNDVPIAVGVPPVYSSEQTTG
jgi:hypothetical protein